MSILNNLVILSGNVGKDPDVKYLDNGTVVANFPLATTESWKDRSGEWQERTTWHNLSCWGDLAKKAELLVKKGIRMSVHGKLANDSWDDKEGVKHYKTYVAIQEFEILALQPRNVQTDDMGSL